MFGAIISANPVFLAGCALGGMVLTFVILRQIRNYRIRQTGGIRAPVLAGNPFTGMRFFIKAGMMQRQNRLLEYFTDIYCHATPECPNCVEISIGPSERFIITREPEHIKAVLTSKFSDFGKGPRFHRTWSPFLGDSIFTTDGQTWQDSRSLIRPMFIKDKVRDLNIFDHWTKVLISKIPPCGQTVDVSDLFYRMTLDVTTDFLLGHSVNSLENPKHEFARSFNEVQRLQMMYTILSPMLPLMPKRRYYKGIKEIEKFIVPYIEQTLAIPPAELEKLSRSDKNFTFLHNIARFSRDPKVIRDQIMAVLLAGRDTTAATLSWCIHELSHYPAALRRLRAEILCTVGASRCPTYEDLKDMTYLTHTINETLRLYPAVPYNIRAALVDSTIPGGPGQPDIAVVRGDVVVYSAISMQRRADIYPPISDAFPDPAIFCPDRWDHWTPKAWTYVPFNGGPRICVGQNFAMTEMAYCLVLLLQKYDTIEYRGDWHAQFHKAEIVGTPGQGVRVAFFEAQDGDVA